MVKEIQCYANTFYIVCMDKISSDSTSLMSCVEDSIIVDTDYLMFQNHNAQFFFFLSKILENYGGYKIYFSFQT